MWPDDKMIINFEDYCESKETDFIDFYYYYCISKDKNEMCSC